MRDKKWMNLTPSLHRALGIQCQFNNTHLAPSPSDPRKWQIQCCPFVFALSPEDPVVVPVFSLGIFVLVPGSQAGVGFSSQPLQVSDMIKYDSIISFILFSFPPTSTAQPPALLRPSQVLEGFKLQKSPESSCLAVSKNNAISSHLFHLPSPDKSYTLV